MATTLEPTTLPQIGPAAGDGLPAWMNDGFQELIDTRTGEIGRVVSSEKEPAGAHQFHFWAADGALTLDVGHIVVAFSEEAAVIGVVDEPRRYSDLRSFMDDYFDRHMEQALAEEAPTRRPEILVYTVTVLATKHPREDVISHRPVVHGPVYFATRDAIEYALDTKNFSGMPIPALMHTNGNYERDAHGDVVTDSETGLPRFQRTPIFLDEDYLLGPEAGHANWTGQSGLATKTSHALFLISSIFQSLKEEKSVAALMFNVKGPDLLWLDKPADPAPGHEAAYETTKWKQLSESDHLAYAALDLEPVPFDQLRIYAPFRPGNTPSAVKTGGTVIHLGSFGGKPEDHAKLNTDRQQPGETGNVFPILWSLKTALWYPHKVFDFNDLDDKMMGFIFELREAKIDSLLALNQKFAEIEDYFANQTKEEKSDYWNGHHKATINKARNRFKSLQDKLGGLLADGEVDYGGSTRQVDAPFAAQEMRVVDISACNSVVQDLIVTSTINKIWGMAEKSELGVDKLIIFVDELNKYAAAGSQSSLRDTLVDIAARGRHLNVVLFGAEQFRSKVDDEILGNCGTALYGRVGDEEIINAAYRSLTETAKAELLGLPKGRLLIRHAHFRAPLFGTFPHPPTLPGMDGQRIFGSQRLSDPCDGLFATLSRLMGDRAPKSAEVKSVAAGLDEEQVEHVRRLVEKSFASGATGYQNPWRVAQKQLMTRRSMSNRS
jgi:hypothetical protein